MRLTAPRMITMLCILSLAQAVAASTDSKRPKADFAHSDIFLFDLDLFAKENVLSNVRQITARPGYDNQPFFTPDSEALLFARGDDYQTDIYEYSLVSGETRQITATSEMEFSPTPSGDNQAIAYVSDSDGSVWVSPRDRVQERKWVFANSSNPESVGYFAWNFATDKMLYWSRFAYSVVLYDHASGERYFVSGHAPPSSPRIIPGTDSFSFIHRQTNEEVWIKEFDPKTKALRPLVKVQGSNNNYAWAPNGAVFMMQGARLYQADPATGPGWKPVADLTGYGIQDARRIAVSPDGSKLAIVGAKATLVSE